MALKSYTKKGYTYTESAKGSNKFQNIKAAPTPMGERERPTVSAVRKQSASAKATSAATATPVSTKAFSKGLADRQGSAPAKSYPNRQGGMDTGNVERTKNPRTWRDRAAIPQDSGDGVTYRKAPRGAVTYKSPFKDKPFKKNNKSTLFIGSKFSMDNAVPPARSVATPVSSEPTFPKGKGTAAQPTRMKYKRLSTDYIKNLMTNVFWMGKGTPR